MKSIKSLSLALLAASVLNVQVAQAALPFQPLLPNRPLLSFLLRPLQVLLPFLFPPQACPNIVFPLACPPPPPPPPIPVAAPGVSFTAPQNSLDLANYTLTARYDLPVGTGANLLGAETSAVTYNRDTGTLFLLGDHGTSVFQVSRTGVFIDTMSFAADLVSDPEGITYLGGGQFAAAEERLREVDRFTYVPGTTLSPAAVQTVKLGTTIGNIGLEGISFDPLTGGFILVKEKTPLGIFQTGINFAAGTATNGSPTTENSTNLFDPALAGAVDFGDVYALSNTLPSAAPDYGHLLVLSQESGVLLKMDRSGKILSRLDVGLPAQHEGVTADENNVLYVSNELGGGAGKPQLWVYTPTTSSTEVGTGSNVYLGFAEPVVAGTGNIVISGGGDTRTIAIGDIDQIRIAGSTIHINPTADLMPGTAYTLTAPAGLVLATAGNRPSPAVNSSFNTRNEAVPPTLTGTMPADNALAVATSRVVLTFSEPVTPGVGSIVITGAGGDVRTIAVGDTTQVAFAGNMVDINPAAPLNPSTAYNVQIASGVIRDVVGNAYAGLIGPDALNFTTATPGAPPPTVLSAGDVLFMGINADEVDAFAFVLLRDVAAGTQIGFTDKDYSASSPTFPTNEAAFTWTANVAYPAGTIVTIQPNTLLADKGLAVGASGGVGGGGETYYAFQGSIINAGTGQITVDRFIAAINIGPAAGDIPAELTAAGSFIQFAADPNDNVRYAGSLDRTDLVAFATLVRNPANWERNNEAGYPLIEGSLFGVAMPPPVGGTMLNPGEVVFMAANADPTDAIAFVILSDVVAGTQIAFTDKDYTAGAPTFPTNEAAFTWQADVDYPAGTIVTLRTDPVATDRGTIVSGAVGGGISTSAETYYAFQGTITNAGAGAITVDRFLAAINLGAAAGDIPPELTSAGAFISFNIDNARYAGSLDRSILATFAMRVKDPANWSLNDTTAFPINTSGSLFGGTSLATGDVLFMAANADAPDAFAFVILKAVVAGTQIAFTDKNYTAGSPFPANEAAFTWTADVAYAAGTIVTVATDPLATDKGTLYGAGGGISPSAETYYAFQGTILNPTVAGMVFVDRFLAAINIRAAAGQIPPEVPAAGSFIEFDFDNVRYAGSLDRSDLAAFAVLVKDPANWETRNDPGFPIVGGALFP
ncbi:MAG: SdiA-regulated domain-containing protein [Panacagrimonas sp.]